MAVPTKGGPPNRKMLIRDITPSLSEWWKSFLSYWLIHVDTVYIYDVIYMLQINANHVPFDSAERWWNSWGLQGLQGHSLWESHLTWPLLSPPLDYWGHRAGLATDHSLHRIVCRLTIWGPNKCALGGWGLVGAKLGGSTDPIFTCDVYTKSTKKVLNLNISQHISTFLGINNENNSKQICFFLFGVPWTSQDMNMGPWCTHALCPKS